MIRLVFWQDFISIHYVALIEALSAIPGYEVVWVVEKDIAPYRAAMGWDVPEVNRVKVVVGPSDADIRQLVSERIGESVHLLTGVHMWQASRKAFAQCVRENVRIALLNEPPIPGTLIRNFAIKPYHSLHTLLCGDKVGLVLGISQMSCNFYKSIGYDESKVFPFGYFLEPAAPATFSSPKPGPFKLVYVGQLIRRKGVDILLKALSRIDDLDWHLEIIGGGTEELALKRLAGRLQIDVHVSFTPSVPNIMAVQSISKSDVLVLPSRHDGWGAVVNEALLCGVPVICSDRCGSADFIAEDWRGNTFAAGSVDDLSRVMRHWIVKGRRTRVEFDAITRWCENIKPAAAASYLTAVIEYNLAGSSPTSERPVAPWTANISRFAKDPSR
jgi:glycosyltransferase involved in cell wall biosynthesis